jgi:hypothetical protein
MREQKAEGFSASAAMAAAVAAEQAMPPYDGLVAPMLGIAAEMAVEVEGSDSLAVRADLELERGTKALEILFGSVIPWQGRHGASSGRV